MLYKKQGFPEEGEIVMCEVTSVQYHSVFVKLTEYNKTGMIHISEISPGRIRNLRDYVTEGKVIVCKVLKVKRDRDQIDLSLRRVNENQRKNKINSMKQEQIAEKIIELVAKERKIDVRDLYNTIKNKISKNHESIYEAFEFVLKDNKYLVKLGIEKEISDNLKRYILDRIKPPSVRIKREMKIKCYEENGVEIIKKSLLKEIKDNINIYYEGGGKYLIEITAENYKEAESIFSRINSDITKSFSNVKAEVEISQK
jgi:translation initiation factor 2 subunit 1